MIIVPPDHCVLRESIKKQVDSFQRAAAAPEPETKEEKKAAKKAMESDVESWVADFDGTMYKIQTGSPEDPTARNLLCMSVRLTGYSAIADKFGPEFLKEIFGDHVRETEVIAANTSASVSSFDATLQVDVSTLATEADADKLAYDWACFKRSVLGFPIRKAFDALVSGTGNAVSGDCAIPYRPTETIYCCPDEGKVTMVFALSFPDPNDVAIARVFLEEFKSARKERKLGAAPSVNVTPKPPGELRDVPKAADGMCERDKNIVGYLALTFEQRHVRTPEMLEKALDMLFSLRTHIHYHIKCCKGYMHTRMRLRVADLLKVLNRADPLKTKEKA